MASVNNYRGGDTRECLMKASSTYPIEKGDLLFLDPADSLVKPASERVNHGSAALNQTAFAMYFAGVALQKNGLQTGETSFRLDTDASMIRVATAGRFEFDCASTSWKVGDFVGVYANSSGCADQTVMAASTAGGTTQERTIGTAVPGALGLSNAMTRVTVEIRSRVMNADVPTVGTYSGTSGQ